MEISTIEYIQMYNDVTVNNEIFCKLFYDIERIAQKIVSEFDEQTIISLLNSENAYERIFIAKYAIDYYPLAAKKSLQKLRFKLGPEGMNARMILKEWKKRSSKRYRPTAQERQGSP